MNEGENNTPAMPTTTEPGQELESVKPFDGRFQQSESGMGSVGYTLISLYEQRTARHTTDPVTITVTEGMEPVVEENGKHDPDVPYGLYGKTISDIYTGIESAVGGMKEAYAKEGYSLNFAVRYNEQYHYPEYFFVSPCYNGEFLDGGGTGIEISAFAMATES
jgi:hypothetical protein